MKRAILTVYLIALTQSALAAEWFHLVGETNDRAVFFDRESVDKSENILTMWVRHIALSESKPLGPNVFSYTNKVKYNCKKKTTTILSGYTYNKSRELTGQVGQLKAQEVVPDTIGNSLFKIACFENFPNSLPPNSALRLGVVDTYEFAAELASRRSKSQASSTSP